MQNIWFFVVEIDVNTIEDSDQTLLNLFLTDARTKAICFAKKCWNYVYTSAILGTPPHNCCNKVFTAEFIGNESPATRYINEQLFQKMQKDTKTIPFDMFPEYNKQQTIWIAITFDAHFQKTLRLLLLKKYCNQKIPQKMHVLRQFHIQQKICNMNWYPGGWAAMDFQFWYVLLMFC